MSRESRRFESWCFDGLRENHKYYSSPKEYNLQRELRRNYGVLFVSFSDIDITEQMFYNANTLKNIICQIDLLFVAKR